MYRRKRRLGMIAGMLCVPFLLASTALAGDDSKPDQQQQKQAKQDSGKKQMNSDNVCAAVKKELMRDRGIPGKQIKVVCNDRKITLKGNVDSLHAKQRAKKLAETVRGVRSVDNELEVKPKKERSASQLNKDVKTALSNDAATRNYDVKAESNDDGEVTLSGHVDSNRQKRLAEKIASSVQGVTSIDNDIEVKASNRSDEDIAQLAEKALQRNNLVDAHDINVNVKDHTVMLSGKVASAAEKTQAETTVWVSGVNDVNADNLQVDESVRSDRNMENGRPSRGGIVGRRDDESIRASIDAGLIDNPRVYSFNVTPKVEDGKVTLTGTVDNLKAKRAASTVAMNTTGVKQVDNEIKVRTNGQVDDSAIARRIEDSMLINPYVSSYDVKVNVKDGVATLTGTVDSYYEKAEADDIAARMTGVKKVDNNLNVNDSYYGLADEPYADDWYVYGYDWYTYPRPKDVESDSEIKEDINDELWWSPFVDSDDVHVSVKNGVATLTGTVEDLSEYRSAAENAREGGAIYVINNLRITETS